MNNFTVLLYNKDTLSSEFYPYPYDYIIFRFSVIYVTKSKIFVIYLRGITYYVNILSFVPVSLLFSQSPTFLLSLLHLFLIRFFSPVVNSNTSQSFLSLVVTFLFFIEILIIYDDSKVSSTLKLTNRNRKEQIENKKSFYDERSQSTSQERRLSGNRGKRKDEKSGHVKTKLSGSM